MRNKPINWPRLVRCSLFQSVLIGTLFIVAAFFATRPQYPYEHKVDTCNSNTYSNNETKEKLIGISPEGWTAIFTGVLAVFTIVLASVSIIQIDFLTRADNNAVESNKITRDVFLAENRPWLSIKVEPISGLEYDDDGDATIEVKFTISNTGRMPAVNVELLPPFGNVEFGGVVVKEFQSYREAMKAGRLTRREIFGEPVFPDGPIIFNKPVTIYKKGIDKVIASGVNYMSIMFFVCVQYSFMNDTNIHETGYIINAGMVDDDGYFTAIRPININIPLERIKFSCLPAGAVAT